MPNDRGKADVIVAGHICLDIIPSFPHKVSHQLVFIPGRLTEVGDAILATGGAVSNTGQSLLRLGIQTKLMGKVGDDHFGRIILDLINELDQDLTEGMIVSKKEESSYTVVLNIPEVDRIFLHCQGTNQTYSMNDLDFEKIEEADIFHFGYPPLMKKMYENDGSELKNIFESVKKRGLFTSLDMAMPDPKGESGMVDWRKFLENAMPYVDMIFPSIEEILYMMKRHVYEDLMERDAHIPNALPTSIIQEIADELIEMGGKIIGLKLGDSGLYLRTAGKNKIAQVANYFGSNFSDWVNRELWIPCYNVNVKGTTGAGDSTIAGFIAGICHQKPVSRVLHYAVGTGAFSVEKTDATSGVPTLEEIERKIESGWNQISIGRHLQGWKFDENARLWVGPNDSMFNFV